LEDSVESLTRQLHSKTGEATVEAIKTGKSRTQDKQYFHLIDSPPNEGSRTKVGVPWDVERAMMGDANKGAEREIRRYEIPIDRSPQLLDELLDRPEEQHAPAPKNDGGFN
jgi:hypothetical protein